VGMVDKFRIGHRARVHATSACAHFSTVMNHPPQHDFDVVKTFRHLLTAFCARRSVPNQEDFNVFSFDLRKGDCQAQGVVTAFAAIGRVIQNEQSFNRVLFALCHGSIDAGRIFVWTSSFKPSQTQGIRNNRYGT
jgi:hypothetical protein